MSLDEKIKYLAAALKRASVTGRKYHDFRNECHCHQVAAFVVAVLEDAETGQIGTRKGATVDIEAAKFRVLLNRLFHNMPMTPETPETVREIVEKLSSLTYVNGKQSVIDALRIVKVAAEKQEPRFPASCAGE